MRAPEAIDREAIVSGALLGIGIIFPTVVLFQIVDATAGIGCDSNWNFVFFVPLVVAWVLGGRLAAKRGPGAPYSNAVIAALAAFAVFAVVRVIGEAVSSSNDCGGDLWAALAFNGMIAASTGIVGALLAGRRP